MSTSFFIFIIKVNKNRKLKYQLPCALKEDSVQTFFIFLDAERLSAPTIIDVCGILTFIFLFENSYLLLLK